MQVETHLHKTSFLLCSISSFSHWACSSVCSRSDHAIDAWEMAWETRRAVIVW
jgi:hypothetical protein